MDNVKTYNDHEELNDGDLRAASSADVSGDSDYAMSDAFLRIDSDYEVPLTPAVTPTPSRARPMQKRRFVTGLLFAAGGIALMLIVAVGALHSAGAEGRLSLPAVALCMIIGLMLLGGGFGVMATAAPTFDDDEFERQVQAGNIPLPRQMFNADVTPPPLIRKDDAEPARTAKRQPQEQAMV